MFQDIRIVAFDLDGTLYFGNEVALGAVELVKAFQEKNMKVVFFTNSSFKSRKEVYHKLSVMGFDLSLEDIYTSGFATARYLKESCIKTIYCVGSDGLTKEFIDADIHVVEADSVLNYKSLEAIVLGLDLEFDFDKLAKIMDMYQHSKCQIIACNKDANYPTSDGRLLPGCGAIVSAVETVIEKPIDLMVGKPNTYMVDLLIRNCPVEHSQIMIIGDSYTSDVQMALNAGCKSILVNDKELVPQNTIRCDNLFEVKAILNSWYKERSYETN